MKSTWFAIILPASHIGFSLAVEGEERSSTLTWMRQRGLRLLGEFPTQQRARQRIDAWLEPQPLQFKAAINKTSSNMISVDPYNRTFPKYPKLIEDKGWIRSNTKLLTNCGMK
jgi:hypothetical protein